MERDQLIESITAEVLRRLQEDGPTSSAPGVAGPTLSAGGRVPLQLHEPNTIVSSAPPVVLREAKPHTPGPVIDLGVLDLCMPCSGCGGCSARRPKTVREMIASGASRISSSAGWAPGDVDLASIIDHTVLKPDATRAEVEQLCAEAVQHGFAAVCVNPTWVRLAAEKVRGSRVAVCTVVGFPLGATLPEVKAYEATRAIRHGATEIDMVINVGELKSGNVAAVERDIRAVVEACRPRILTKVILETALLTREEKIIACRLSKAAGADFVKTSTGFAKGGATVEDVRLMREVVGEEMGVKASGGIREYDSAMLMVEAGATRLGTSASVKIVQGGARRSSRVA